jgi:hypothetical protein
LSKNLTISKYNFKNKLSIRLPIKLLIIVSLLCCGVWVTNYRCHQLTLIIYMKNPIYLIYEHFCIRETTQQFFKILKLCWVFLQTNCSAERYFSCSKIAKISYDLLSIKKE